MVKLVELGLEEFLVREKRLVFGDECGRERSAEGVFDDFLVLRGAEKEADGRVFVAFADVTVEGFD